MSFGKDTKNDLCALPVKKPCCRAALLYGMLLCGNVFSPEKIRLVTEHERTSALILHLLSDVYGVRGSVYINEKKSGDRKISSYKLTVSARDDLKKIFAECALPPDCEGAVNPELFKCDECFRYFLRGAFLTAGTVTDPMSGYRLELTFENEHLALTMQELLSSFGFSAKYAKRQSSFVIYLKESENVEDFLTYVGASQASLAVMNAKIYKDIRNAQNRLSNCDAANINKMTGKAQEHIRMIRALRRTGAFDALPEDLKTTAALREENPMASLALLAELHDPPITKSGVNHRLAKIAEQYEKTVK